MGRPGRLAQLVERLPYKQEAGGSRPSPPIIESPPNVHNSEPMERAGWDSLERVLALCPAFDPHTALPLWDMPRPATGSVRSRVRNGRTQLTLRFSAYGQRIEIPAGTDDETRARARLDEILDQVKRGTWQPPTPTKPAPRRAAEPTFGEFAEQCAAYVYQPAIGGWRKRAFGHGLEWARVTKHHPGRLRSSPD
jgi:hypothetical protein